MQIKATMIFHYTTIRMVTTLKTATPPNVDKYAEKMDYLHITHWNIKWYRPSGKEFSNIL